MEAPAENNLRWWISSRKGKKKAIPEAGMDLNIIFEPPARTVALFASNLSFHKGGGLVINLQKVPKKTTNTQARISIPESFYTDFLRLQAYQQAWGCMPSNTVWLNCRDAGTLFETLQLQLPANHEYLKMFDFLSAARGLFDFIEIEPFEETMEWHLRADLVNRYTITQSLILLKHRMIQIIDNTENGWIVDEKYSSMLHYTRLEYSPFDLLSRRTLQAFCDGAGPSDYSVRAKRHIYSIVAHHQNHFKYLSPYYTIPPCPIDACWAYLFENKRESLSVSRSSINTISKSDRLELLKEPSMEQVIQNLVLRKDDEKEKMKHQNSQRKDVKEVKHQSIQRKSFKAFKGKIKSLVSGERKKGSKKVKIVGMQAASTSSSNGAPVVESSRGSSQSESDKGPRESISSGSSNNGRARVDSLMQH